jgi:hypothetical protein
MTSTKDEALQHIARHLNEVLEIVFGERVAFALLIFRSDHPTLADYLSNVEREEMIKALRETANRLENGEDFPRIIGEA